MGLVFSTFNFSTMSPQESSSTGANGSFFNRWLKKIKSRDGEDGYSSANTSSSSVDSIKAKSDPLPPVPAAAERGDKYSKKTSVANKRKTMDALSVQQSLNPSMTTESTGSDQRRASWSLPPSPTSNPPVELLAAPALESLSSRENLQQQQRQQQLKIRQRRSVVEPRDTRDQQYYAGVFSRMDTEMSVAERKESIQTASAHHPRMGSNEAHAMDETVQWSKASKLTSNPPSKVYRKSKFITALPEIDAPDASEFSDLLRQFDSSTSGDLLENPLLSAHNSSQDKAAMIHSASNPKAISPLRVPSSHNKKSCLKSALRQTANPDKTRRVKFSAQTIFIPAPQDMSPIAPPKKDDLYPEITNADAAPMVQRTTATSDVASSIVAEKVAPVDESTAGVTLERLLLKETLVIPEASTEQAPVVRPDSFPETFGDHDEIDRDVLHAIFELIPDPDPAIKITTKSQSPKGGRATIQEDFDLALRLMNGNSEEPQPPVPLPRTSTQTETPAHFPNNNTEALPTKRKVKRRHIQIQARPVDFLTQATQTDLVPCICSHCGYRMQ